MSIAERIKQLRGKVSRKDFAESLDIVPNTLRNYEDGLSLPNSDVIAKICTVQKVSLEWLVFGVSGVTDIQIHDTPLDPPKLAALEHQQEKAYRVYDEAGVEVIEADKIDIILIPLVEATLSAGQGSFEVSDKSERKYSFRRDFLQRKGNYKRMVLMRVGGDSMAPAIEDGDVVLLDQSQTAPVPGSIYAVGVEDMVYLKRVDARPGKLILYSDNQAYKPIEIDTRGDMAEQARIIGRAIWWCREA